MTTAKEATLDMQGGGSKWPWLGTIRARYTMKLRQCYMKYKVVSVVIICNLPLLFALALELLIDHNIITYSSDHLRDGIVFGLSGLYLFIYPLAVYLDYLKHGGYTSDDYAQLGGVIAFLGGAFSIMLYFNGSISENSTILLNLSTLISAPLFFMPTFKFLSRHFNLENYPVTCICWHTWISYTGIYLLQILFHSTRLPEKAFEFAVFITVPILVILMFVCVKPQTLTFLYHQAKELINDFRLVYNVILYTIRNRGSIHSCGSIHSGDKLPSMFDLAKKEYGGPYPCWEVDSVKTLLRILRVFLALDPVFVVDILASKPLPIMFDYTTGEKDFIFQTIPPEITSKIYLIKLIISSSMSVQLISIISIYPVLKQLRIYDKNPQVLKHRAINIQLGMIIQLLSLISVLLYYFLAAGNYFSNYTYKTLLYCLLNIVMGHGLKAIAYVHIYTSVHQFILHMIYFDRIERLVIGSFFVIKGIFQLLAVLTVYLPFISWSSDSSYALYYLINITIALIGIVFYTWQVLRQYRRKKNEKTVKNVKNVHPNEHANNLYNYLYYDLYDNMSIWSSTRNVEVEN